MVKALKKKPKKPVKKSPIRVAQGIETIGGLLTEQARLYRAARRGEITPAAGHKLMSMLTAIRGTIEVVDIDAKIRELIARAENKP